VVRVGGVVVVVVGVGSGGVGGMRVSRNGVGVTCCVGVVVVVVVVGRLGVVATII